MVLTVDNCSVAYFTMRMLGHGRHGHILQLAAKFANGKNIAVWIEPSEYVAENASEVDGLRAQYGKLFYHNEFLPTVPLEVALRKLLMFLKTSSKPVVIVSHSVYFCFMLLLQAIMETDMVDQFDSIVDGFSDTLPSFAEVFKDRNGPGQFELESLAYDILEETYEEKFLGALESLDVLEKLVNARSLTPSIFEHHKSFEKSLLNEMGAQHSFEIVEGLVCLREIVSIGLIKRFAEAGASWSSLVEMVREQGADKLKQFLSEKQANGKARITESSSIHEKIVAFLQKPQKPRAIDTPQHDEEIPEIKKNIPLYAQIDPFKKRQDRINREIDLLRQQQPQDYNNIDSLRQPDCYRSPTDQSRRPSWPTYPKIDNTSASKPASRLYEDPDSLENQATNRGQTHGRPESGDNVAQSRPQLRPESNPYEDPDAIWSNLSWDRGQAAQSRPESNLYEDFDDISPNLAWNRGRPAQPRPESMIFEDLDAIWPNRAWDRGQAAQSRPESNIYEDPDAIGPNLAQNRGQAPGRAQPNLYVSHGALMRNAARNREQAQSRPESNIYDDPDVIFGNPVSISGAPFSRAESGDYADLYASQNQASNRQQTSTRPESGLYENVEPVQRRAQAAAQPANQRNRIPEANYENLEVHQQTAPEETVELRQKRQSQGNRGETSARKRLAMHENMDN